MTNRPNGSIGTLGALSIGVGGIVGGGFFATHPATGDRIQAVKNLPG